MSTTCSHLPQSPRHAVDTIIDMALWDLMPESLGCLKEVIGIGGALRKLSKLPLQDCPTILDRVEVWRVGGVIDVGEALSDAYRPSCSCNVHNSIVLNDPRSAIAPPQAAHRPPDSLEFAFDDLLRIDSSSHSLSSSSAVGGVKSDQL